jgi:hypothetical protein
MYAQGFNIPKLCHFDELNVCFPIAGVDATILGNFLSFSSFFLKINGMIQFL